MDYRRYQLYTGIINVCLAPVVYPTMISAWSVLIVVGVYTAIRLFSSIPLPMYALFVLLAVDGVLVVNFCMVENGKINKRSEQILEKFRLSLSNFKKANRKTFIERKEVKSLGPLKIKMGSSNFFEMSTPLEILSLCVDNIINLLLAS